MIVVNTDFISGKELETLGLVTGKRCLDNKSAILSMEEEAESLKADAVVNVRYVSYERVVTAYGTAVKFKNGSQ
jgi:uncharacterized protein YbjQ (UPF0145 family)